SGKVLIDPNVGPDETDSDAIDQGNGVSIIPDIDVVADQDTPNNDAGVAAPVPCLATIVGDTSMYEGQVKSFQVQVDNAVTEDTTFFLDIRDLGANYQSGYTSGIQNQDIMWGGYYSVVSWWSTQYVYGRVPNATDARYGDRPMVGPAYATWDYSTSMNGMWDDQYISLTIKAGQTKSDSFQVSAWNEKITTDNLIHSSTAGIEYNEYFSININSVSGDDCVTIAEQSQMVQIIDQSWINRVSPVALDLNGDGKIDVTGETSSRLKDPEADLGRTVQFDIDADGDLDTIEWIECTGDGLLVDMSKIGADGTIDGSALFGDDAGRYANGYENLAQHDDNGDGLVSGAELEGIGLWIDDGDAVLEDGELQSAAEAGIASVSTQMEIVSDDKGRDLMRSTASTTDGEEIMSEDVWFATTTEDILDIAADPAVAAANLDLMTEACMDDLG
ncbi:hypothetical protein, partial [Thiorhodococcus minor]|nr:hypothetical protein [Thiorhodococcus minor]